MNTFSEYEKLPWIQFDPDFLDMAPEDRRYILVNGPDPLLTPGGQKMIAGTERLARLLLVSMMQRERIDSGLRLHVLHGFRLDRIESGTDPLPASWEETMGADPFVAIKTTGKYKPGNEQDGGLSVSYSFNLLTGLVQAVNRFIAMEMSNNAIEESSRHPFPLLLRNSYDRLSPGEKAAVQCLSGIHDSAIVLPLLIVRKLIDPLDYSGGLVALSIRGPQHQRAILSDAAAVQSYTDCENLPGSDDTKAAWFIGSGESDKVEFKSTLRWDIRAGKTNPAIERASLKTIAAFLNTAGGTLLIGVRDDGSIEGIESDKFANEDKFLLHLWTLIRTSLGRDVSPWISTVLEKSGEKTVCLVRCARGSRPVFLRQAGFDEEFYIRVGPSSNAMDISEALRYIHDHFKGD